MREDVWREDGSVGVQCQCNFDSYMRCDKVADPTSGEAFLCIDCMNEHKQFPKRLPKRMTDLVS